MEKIKMMKVLVKKKKIKKRKIINHFYQEWLDIYFLDVEDLLKGD
jgi:hypothetical protein